MRKHSFTVLLITIFGCNLLASSAKAQPGSKNEPEIPPPQSVTLVTKDRVSIALTYFEGNAGKKTVPVLLVHGATGPMGDGSGRDCLGLASFLQKQGHAVFVPDLRGFGDSQIQTVNGRKETLEPQRFRRKQYREMVDFDLEAVKKFVIEKHNRGELNADLLAVVGFDMGAVVALNWVHLDWNMPSFPNLKQGQDVKAMVLVSLMASYKGLTIKDAIADPKVRRRISTLIAFGSGSPKIAAASRRLFKSLERTHPEIAENDPDRLEKQDLFKKELATSLQGTRLLTATNLGLKEAIGEFIQLRIVQKRDRYPWQKRGR